MPRLTPNRLIGPRRPAGSDRLVLAAGLAVSLLAVGWVAGAFGAISNDTWTVVVPVVVLTLGVAMLAGRLARADGDPMLRWFLVGAFAVKLMGTFLRYQVLYEVYDGGGDSLKYHSVGKELASQFSSGNFNLGDSGLIGTRFIEVVTGYLYWVLAPSRVLGFVVFSFLGFLGLVLFTRAYRTGVPDGRIRLYDTLVLFLPSMFYWPSSLGKEAWMTLALGLTALGAARLLANRAGAVLPVAAGLTATLMVRPHVSLIVVGSLAAAYLLRASRTGFSDRALKLAGVAVLVLATLFVATRVEDFFGVEQIDLPTVGTVLDDVQVQTGQGGSLFEARRVQSPLDLPGAAVTVLYRPFPWEATEVQQLLASAEGLLLLGLCLIALRHPAELARRVARHPYLVFATVFALAFIVAFSSINNFGILARQRVQLYPFVFAVIVPVAASVRGRRARDEDAVMASQHDGEPAADPSPDRLGLPPAARS